MTIESHVVSLELAKRLDELGIKKQSYFYWCNFALEWTLFHPVTRQGDKDGPSDFWLLNDLQNRELACSAYLTSELLDLLPKATPRNDKPWQQVDLKIEPANRLGHWLVSYGFDVWMEENTIANALAKLLIHLIENNIVSADDISKEGAEK